MAPCHLNYFHHCQRESWFVVQGEFQRADVAFDKRPRQLYLPVGVNQFCRFTSLAWTRCWAALVR